MSLGKLLNVSEPWLKAVLREITHLKYPARCLGSESAKYMSGCYAFSSMLPCSAQRQERDSVSLQADVEARLRE